jgi:hypothetical protein
MSEGGLGNQLFQASYAHYLSLVFPEASVYFVNDNSRSDREFELTDFFVSCVHVKQKDSRIFFGKTNTEIKRGMSRRFGSKADQFIQRNMISEIGGLGNQNERILGDLNHRRKNYKTIVRGYFQYFNNLFSENDCFAALFLESIGINASSHLTYDDLNICLHIRRGDYLSNFSFGPLKISYFSKLLDEYRTAESRISIHSDNSNMLEDELLCGLQLSENSFSGNPWDLFVDALHSELFIGSNSSLSWWAGFALEKFGRLPNKIIIFPNEWFRGISTVSLGIIPPSWKLSEASWQ